MNRIPQGRREIAVETICYDRPRAIVIRNLIPEDYCKQMERKFNVAYENGETDTKKATVLVSSNSSKNTERCNDIFSLFSYEQLRILPTVSEIASVPLFPTYNLTRKYYRDEYLPKHVDRSACQISISINLGSSSKTPWPISIDLGYVDNSLERLSKLFWENGKPRNREEIEPVEIYLNRGDAIYYEAMVTPHWRNPLQTDWSLHTFFHFVEAYGPFKDEAFAGWTKDETSPGVHRPKEIHDLFNLYNEKNIGKSSEAEKTWDTKLLIKE